jgi:hypothetical protein
VFVGRKCRWNSLPAYLIVPFACSKSPFAVIATMATSTVDQHVHSLLAHTIIASQIKNIKKPFAGNKNMQSASVDIDSENKLK